MAFWFLNIDYKMIIKGVIILFQMHFYGFEKKKISSHIRRECKRTLSEDVEHSLHEFITREHFFDERQYTLAMQQLMCDQTEQQRLERIKKGEIGWNHPSISDDVLDVDEMRDYIQKPLEVEEGVIECTCGSNRVFSYQKQTRGCDESSTTFAQCAKCGRQWTYSG